MVIKTVDRGLFGFMTEWLEFLRFTHEDVDSNPTPAMSRGYHHIDIALLPFVVVSNLEKI